MQNLCSCTVVGSIHTPLALLCHLDYQPAAVNSNKSKLLLRSHYWSSKWVNGILNLCLAFAAQTLQGVLTHRATLNWSGVIFCVYVHVP